VEEKMKNPAGDDHNITITTHNVWLFFKLAALKLNVIQYFSFFNMFKLKSLKCYKLFFLSLCHHSQSSDNRYFNAFVNVVPKLPLYQCTV